jgi:hypothetical protein
MAVYPEDQEWRDIAKQVSIEMDPAKLTILVGELFRALDERNERKPQARYPFSLGGHAKPAFNASAENRAIKRTYSGH